MAVPGRALSGSQERRGGRKEGFKEVRTFGLEGSLNYSAKELRACWRLKVSNWGHISRGGRVEEEGPAGGRGPDSPSEGGGLYERSMLRSVARM